MENTLEDLVSTIERNAIDNKAEITNVPLWANSWREDFKEKLELLIAESELDEYDAEMKLSSIKHTLEDWIKQMEGIENKNQISLI